MDLSNEVFFIFFTFKKFQLCQLTENTNLHLEVWFLHEELSFTRVVTRFHPKTYIKIPTHNPSFGMRTLRQNFSAAAFWISYPRGH